MSALLATVSILCSRIMEPPNQSNLTAHVLTLLILAISPISPSPKISTTPQTQPADASPFATLSISTVRFRKPSTERDSKNPVSSRDLKRKRNLHIRTQSPRYKKTSHRNPLRLVTDLPMGGIQCAVM